MNLANQSLENIKLLLDKPQSMAVDKEILAIISKQMVTIQKCCYLFCTKFRGQLLVEVLSKYAVPLQNYLQILTHLKQNIVEFKIGVCCDIFKMALTNQQFTRQNLIEQGFVSILRDAVKITNEQKKNKLFEVASSNIVFLWQRGEKQIVRVFIESFIQVFLKFNIYLHHYALLISIAIKFNDEKDQSNQSIDIITFDARKLLLTKLIHTLDQTKDRQIYAFQKQILNCINSILSNSKYAVADILLANSCMRVIQPYLYNKPTRDEARKVKQICEEQLKCLDQLNQQKMIKVQRPSSQIHPTLIENIIDKGLQYRQKYQAEKVTPYTQFNFKRQSYLKKGVGVGGGKAVLQSQPSLVIPKNKYQDIINSCLSSNQPNQHFIIETQAKKRLTSNFWSGQKQEKGEEQSISQTVLAESRLEQDEYYDQISNLIELAYEYKFSASNYD